MLIFIHDSDEYVNASLPFMLKVEKAYQFLLRDKSIKEDENEEHYKSFIAFLCQVLCIIFSLSPASTELLLTYDCTQIYVISTLVNI